MSSPRRLRINGRKTIRVSDPDNITDEQRRAWAAILNQELERQEQEDSADWHRGNVLQIIGILFLMFPCALAQLPPLWIGPVFLPITLVVWTCAAFLIFRGYQIKTHVIDRREQ